MKRMFDENEIRQIAGGNAARSGGSATLYEHNISFSMGDFPVEKVFCTIYSTDKTPFTTNSLLAWLYKRNFYDFGIKSMSQGPTMISITYSKGAASLTQANLDGNWIEGTSIVHSGAYLVADAVTVTDTVTQR